MQREKAQSNLQSDFGVSAVHIELLLLLYRAQLFKASLA